MMENNKKQDHHITEPGEEIPELMTYKYYLLGQNFGTIQTTSFKKKKSIVKAPYISFAICLLTQYITGAQSMDINQD